MNCFFMIKEPTAAGIPFLLPEMKDGYGDGRKDVQEGDCILVFDIGGGTLDITIIRREGQKYQVIGNGEVQISVETILTGAYSTMQCRGMRRNLVTLPSINKRENEQNSNKCS